MQQELQHLITRHCKTLVQESAAIGECLSELNHNHTNENPILAEAIGLAHKIKGSSGSIGFAQVSECARALEGHMRTAAVTDGPLGYERYSRIMAWYKRLDYVVNTLTSEQSSLFNGPALQAEAKFSLESANHKSFNNTIETESLLLVDDCNDARAFLSMQLKKEGFSVCEAPNGAEALKKLKNEEISLVLLDLSMPQMDGMETLAHIRQEHSFVDLPIIIVTANRQSESTVKALKLGANDYVSKPVDVQTLSARINAQLHNRQTVTELTKAKNHLENEIEERAFNLRQQQLLATTTFNVAHRAIMRDVEAIESDLRAIGAGDMDIHQVITNIKTRSQQVRRECLSLGLFHVASVAEQLEHSLDDLLSPLSGDSSDIGSCAATRVTKLADMCKKISVEDLSPQANDKNINHQTVSEKQYANA